MMDDDDGDDDDDDEDDDDDDAPPPGRFATGGRDASLPRPEAGRRFPGGRR